MISIPVSLSVDSIKATSELRVAITKTQMAHPPQPLNVFIVGGGIGGLTAAVSLRRQGHHVEILEALKDQTEIGSISIQINAMRVVQHLGAVRENFNGVNFEGIIVFHSDSTQGSTQRWLVPEAVDDPGLFCNRKDVCAEIRRLALTEDGVGRPVNIRVGARVVACNPDDATLTLDGGEIIHADLILGCDGIGSIIRTSILGNVQKAPSSGMSCFRALFDASKLDGIPELSWITDGISGARFVASKEEPFCALFVNLCEGGKLINLVAIHMDPTQDDPKWSQAATHEEVIQRFKHFHPNFLRLLDLPVEADGSFIRWKLLALPELPTWTRGRVALVGDAAHATFPSLGQGAAMAIEEAGVLGGLLPLGTTTEDIPARLEAYQSLCKPRGDFVRTESLEQMIEPAKRGRYFNSQEIQARILEYDAIESSRALYETRFGHVKA
ncbi:hypothetical protein C8R44DRAFT_677411 [Mycena epipterygia]|nr:hypothetical protein C8R44DRAFT_677411 [Mycena epipterygia]